MSFIDEQKIKPNIDTLDSVSQKCGSPTFISNFPVDSKNQQGEVWYYIFRKTKTTSFFDPKPITQEALVVQFSNKGIVESVQKTLGITKDVKISSKKTELTGYKTGVMRDIFGSMGKSFNKVKIPEQ
jgi:outer membrane protein assembly factor BamE (lipoprotein component of BamABCDE complex)